MTGPTTILITAASGRTSRFVTRALLDSPTAPAPNLRLLVHSKSGIDKLRAEFPQLPASAFVIGDFLEASTLPPALKGVDVVFHNAPAFHQQETAMGIAIVDAAKEAGVKHFVYCSVFLSILTKLLNHKVKRDVEEYLVESGLSFTILQPTSFMQNIDIGTVLTTHTIPAVYETSVLQGYIDLHDLAFAATLVLLDPAAHNRARYELVGQNCTYEDVAATFGALLGKEVRIARAERAEVVRLGMGRMALKGSYAVDALDRMLFYYDKRGIPGNSNVLRWLLGREPTTWDVLIRREVQGA